MRILVVSNLYPPVVHGGYEVECAGAVELLRNRGDDVHVLTTRADGVTDDDPFVARDLHFVPETRRAELSATLPTLFERALARICRSFSVISASWPIQRSSTAV